MTPGRTLVGPTLRDGFSGALIFGGVANRSGVVSFGRRVGMVPLCGQPLTGAMDSAKKKPRLSAFYPDRLPTFGFRLVGHLTHMGQLGILAPVSSCLRTSTQPLQLWCPNIQNVSASTKTKVNCVYARDSGNVLSHARPGTCGDPSLDCPTWYG